VERIWCTSRDKKRMAHIIGTIVSGHKWYCSILFYKKWHRGREEYDVNEGNEEVRGSALLRLEMWLVWLCADSRCYLRTLNYIGRRNRLTPHCNLCGLQGYTDSLKPTQKVDVCVSPLNPFFPPPPFSFSHFRITRSRSSSRTQPSDPPWLCD
jgi:hypothetical protein